MSLDQDFYVRKTAVVYFDVVSDEFSAGVGADCLRKRGINFIRIRRYTYLLHIYTPDLIFDPFLLVFVKYPPCCCRCPSDVRFVADSTPLNYLKYFFKRLLLQLGWRNSVCFII